MPASDITHLPVTDILVETRLREASGPAVASIASSILEVGEILKPLIVRKVKDGYRLLDGLHRLEAAKQIELDAVPVRIMICTNNEAVRIEVDANVASAPLTPLDMAVFLAAHKELYEKEYPEVRRGSSGGRAKNGVLTDEMSVSSFAANAAEVLGKGERQIYRLISVGEKLDRKHIDLLREAPNRVQFSDLEQIAKCANPIDRIDICEALHYGTAKNAKEVLARKKQPGVAVQSAVDKAQGKLDDAWARASKEAKRRFVAAHLEDLAELLAEHEDYSAPDIAPEEADVIPFGTRREVS